MSRAHASLIGLMVALPAQAGWLEDHYPTMNQVLQEMGLSAPAQIRFNVLYDQLKASGSLRCDQPAPAGTPKWDVTCVGTVSSEGAELCGALAATAAMELRLRDLVQGRDRSHGVVLDCGGVLGQGWVQNHKAGGDGHVQADTRNNGIVVWTRSSTLTATWAPATGDDRVLAPEEALAAANRVLAARAPVDEAWTALAGSLETDVTQFEPLRVKLAAAARSAAATAHAASTSGQERPLQAALVARLDAYVAVAAKLAPFVQLATDASTAPQAQALLDQAAADCAAADLAYIRVVREFAAAYGLADTTQATP